MYEAFFGLRCKPFELHPDPRFVYLSPGHDDVLTHLEYAVEQGKGFVVITGEVGAGKTTLIKVLLERLPAAAEVGLVNNTSVSPTEFLKFVCQELEVPLRGDDKPALLDALNQHLIANFAAGKRVVLIIDEAQNLPRATLEEVRMLSNLETAQDHLLQIFLLGQPELRRVLQRREAQQFLQRVTVHCHLRGLSRREVSKYVRHRLQVAGAERADVFSDDAMDALWVYSSGIPRILNVLCDTALLFAYGEGVSRVDQALVESVVRSRTAGGLGFGADGSEGEAEPSRATALGEVLRELEVRLQCLEGRLRDLEVERDLLRDQVRTTHADQRQLLEAFKLLKRRLDGQAPLAPLAMEVPGSRTQRL